MWHTVNINKASGKPVGGGQFATVTQALYMFITILSLIYSNSVHSQIVHVTTNDKIIIRHKFFSINYPIELKLIEFTFSPLHMF